MGSGRKGIGYVLISNGADERGAAVLTLLAVVSGVGVVLGVWRLTRHRLMMGELVRLAREFSDDRRPSAEVLRACGREIGIPVLDSETTPLGAVDYARRVFGVNEAAPAKQHMPQEDKTLRLAAPGR